ncbi:MAG TPA: hypothetical protein DIC34_13895 [Treponema sp.]|nr:hypothetical protein [Treponema sp.]
MMNGEGHGRTERILVAVGASPSSANLVHWAARFARMRDAECLALYVDSGAALGPEGRRRLDDNLCLARTLGARVEVLPGGDLAKSILDAAREKGVFLIVVGRSGLSRPRLFPKTITVSDRIVREAGAIAVAVVQDRDAPPVPPSTVPANGPRGTLRELWIARFARIAAAAALFAGLIIIGYSIAPIITYRGVALVYLAAILGLSFFANPGTVALCALVSALALNFFFIPPRYTFSIGEPADWLLFGVYFLVAFVTGGLVARLRSREKLLAQRQRAASFLLEAAEKLAPCSSAAEAAATAASLAIGYFGLPVFVFADESGGADAVGEADGVLVRGGASTDEMFTAAARRAFTGGIDESAGPDGARLRAIPSSGGDRAGVVIGIELPEGRVWTVSDDELISSLGKTLALIIERERSEEASRRSSLELGSQRLAKVLLDSVSHEMRTPLTTITGSLSALRDDALAERPDARKAILEGALDASASLNRIVEDILSAGRIESGMLKLKREATDPADIVESAVEESRSSLGDRDLSIRLPAVPRPAVLDGALVSRMVANLLRNAGKYSWPGAPVELALAEEGAELIIRVVDAGPGVDREREATLFEKFKKSEGRSKGGLGLGLAICKGIAEAHGGSISAYSGTGTFTVEARFPGCVEEEA